MSETQNRLGDGTFTFHNRPEGDTNLAPTADLTAYVVETVKGTDVRVGDYLSTNHLVNNFTERPGGDNPIYEQFTMNLVATPLRRVTGANIDPDNGFADFTFNDEFTCDSYPEEDVVRLAPDETGRKQLEAIDAIAQRALTLTPAECEDISRINREINDGAWGDLRTAANRAQLTMYEELYTEDDCAVSLVFDQVSRVYAAPQEVHRARGEDLTDAQFAAYTVAQHVAQGVANRHLIGDPRFPAWTHEAYEHTVRPWQLVVGKAHPDDADEPLSWSRRPIS